MPSRSISEVVRFGDHFELDRRAYELRRDGRPLKLERIPMELLLLLVEREGELVSREQIIARIWGKDVYLDTDNSINAAIRKIRQVLRDDPERPRFVQTITGKGYRFIAALQTPSSLREEAGPGSLADSLIGKKVSHYRVLEVLGGGGMGVVYKAEDLKLGRRVALKFLPAELARDPKAFARFEQEARAASALDHPNICSIYQLGEHEGQPFIVMPLLEGQTLREWIESPARQSTPEGVKQLVEIAIQVAEGLEAAHQKGIIHRDIKPANLFLTTRGQVKILDFGVAKYMEAAGNAESVSFISAPVDTGAFPPPPHLTQTATTIGTPSYLSPEQIQRETVDARSDLFSFGLVLYEMATGKQAFPGNTVTVIRDAVLNEPATPVRELNPDVPVRLANIISRSLEKDRNRRYQSARELREDLQLLRAAGAPIAAKRFPIRTWAPVAASILVVALFLFNVGGLRRRWLGSAPPALPGKVEVRPAVAVLGFNNLSGETEHAWISTALVEMVAAELAAGQQLRVLPSEDVTRMKVDLSLSASDSYGRNTLSRIRNHSGADLVVFGSYLRTGPGGKIRIDLQLQDARSGESIATISQDGPEENLADLVSRSGARLRQSLGMADVSPADAVQVRASMPANPEAARLYALGLAKLQGFDAQAARDLLQKAVAADPKHALSHSALAEAWAALGYEQRAQQEAGHALDLSGNLTREERLFVEARYRELSRDLPQAIEIYRTLRNFFPDNLGYALHLATAQANGGLADEGLQSVKLMRALPAPMNQDARIDLAEASAAEALSDFQHSQKAALAAAARAEAQGSRLLLAAAKVREGWASLQLGESDRALAAYSRARELWIEGGNARAAAAALHGIASIQRDRGDFVNARASYEDALNQFRKIGSLRDLASCSHNFGVLFYYQGELAQAKRYLEEALRIQREIKDERGVASDLDDLGNVLMSMGDLAGALETKEQALLDFRRLNNKYGEAITLLNMGDVLFVKGELQPAREKFEQAMAIAEQTGDKRGIGYCLLGLAGVLMAEDRLADARAKAEQSIVVREQTKDEATKAESRAQLAKISLEQGNALEAESLSRDAVAVFDRQAVMSSGSVAMAVQARALRMEGRITEAQAAANRALSLSRRSGDVSARLEAMLAAAEVQTESGQFETAARLLEEVLQDANRLGAQGYQLEARWLLGRLEFRSGKTNTGRLRLQQLRRDAQGKGFVLLARKSAAALR